MVWVMVVVRVMVRVRECVKVSHVIFQCRVINYHPVLKAYNF